MGQLVSWDLASLALRGYLRGAAIPVRRALAWTPETEELITKSSVAWE
jgi:hypothetical protein